MFPYSSDSVKAFESYALIAQSSVEMDFYLRNSLSIDEQYVECRECIVYHKGDLGNFLITATPETNYSLECINHNIPAFKLEHKRKEEGHRNQGIFIVLKGTNNYLYRVITVSRGEFWNNGVKPFLRKKYPALSIIYFRQKELEFSLLSFEKQLLRRFSDRSRISVVEVTRKSERASKLDRKAKYINTERSWTKSSFSETFAELKERGFWFTSLKFQIFSSTSPKGRYFRLSTGKVYKFGSFSCTNMYEEFRTFLIEPLEQVAAERMKLLEGRGIIERNYQPGPPLEIVYDEDIFDSTTKVRQFGATLNHYRDASIVVYHGNPYFHANIADLRDGSSFEIWILSQKRILISPQAKTSAQALARVITFIFDRFKEGALSEYNPGTE